ncbi:MAG: hypothetical protein K0Q70_2870 [Rhodospirillales bacterium]|nr:hypothetical protein [Rhodospirillales bacterium]
MERRRKLKTRRYLTLPSSQMPSHLAAKPMRYVVPSVPGPWCYRATMRGVLYLPSAGNDMYPTRDVAGAD